MEEMRPDHVIRSSVAITKFILKKNNNDNKKEMCDFFKIFFLAIFLILSGLVIVHYWLRNTAGKFYGEILCKSRYLT